jgi:hypothetical protein
MARDQTDFSESERFGEAMLTKGLSQYHVKRCFVGRLRMARPFLNTHCLKMSNAQKKFSMDTIVTTTNFAPVSASKLSTSNVPLPSCEFWKMSEICSAAPKTHEKDKTIHAETNITKRNLLNFILTKS